MTPSRTSRRLQRWHGVVHARCRASGASKSVKELAAYAKANPRKLNWGFGTAAGPHLFGEMFVAATGIDVARISYKSGPQAIPDISGGRIHMNFGVTVNFLPLVHDGKLRALAVTSEARDQNLPNVPTMMEVRLAAVDAGILVGAAGAGGHPDGDREQAQR